MAKRLNETERKKFLRLQLFYLNVKKEINDLEIRLGIEEEQKESIELHLEIRNENQN